MSQNLQDPTQPHAKPPGDSITGSDGVSCSNCGKVNPLRAKFCPNCGRPILPIEQVSTMQFGPLLPSPEAQLSLNAEASTAKLLSALEQEETAPIIRNQAALSSIPPAYSATPIPISQNQAGTQNSGGWRSRITSKRSITIGLITLILLFISSSLPFLVPYLHTVLPASNATVTITPVSKHFRNNYFISAVIGIPNTSQHQVQARFISFTTTKQAKTVQASGQGTEGVTEATGTLVFSNSSGGFTIFAQTFADNSGVGLTIDSAFNIFPGQTVSIFAHAAKAGTVGNVPADDINSSFTVGTNLGTIHIENTSPFSGGRDRPFSFVQQSDIDSATASLQDQLTSAAQAGLKNLIHAGEQLFIDPNSGTGNGMQCTSSISPDHKANDRAPNVSVTGTATCKGEVYDAQAAQTMATNLLKSDAAAQLGMSYTLTGNVVAGDPTSTTSNQNGTISLNYAPQGLWVYQFNSGQKLLLAKLIVGKTQADTTALLLKQTGIQKARIQTSGGWGTALPTSPDSINIAILSVPGL